MFPARFDLTEDEKKSIEKEVDRVRMEETMNFLLPKAEKWMEENKEINEKCKEILLRHIRTRHLPMTEEDQKEEEKSDDILKSHPCLGCIKFKKDEVTFKELDDLKLVLNNEVFFSEGESVKIDAIYARNKEYRFEPKLFGKRVLYSHYE